MRLVADALQCLLIGIRLAGELSANDISASMTVSGVRSSCEASAVKSSARRRARSIGAATRRPIAHEPKKTASRRTGAMSPSARRTV